MYQNNESSHSNEMSNTSYNYIGYQSLHSFSPLSNSSYSSSCIDSSFYSLDQSSNGSEYIHSNYNPNNYNAYYNYNSSSPNFNYNYGSYFSYNYQNWNDHVELKNSIKEGSIKSNNEIKSSQVNSTNINREVTYKDEKNFKGATKSDKQVYSRKHQLPEKAVDFLNCWFDDHLNNPYPSLEEKEKMARLGGITIKQVNAWFSNRRNRSQNTKPKRMKRAIENEFNNIVNVLSKCRHDSDKQQIIENFKKNLTY